MGGGDIEQGDTNSIGDASDTDEHFDAFIDVLNAPSTATRAATSPATSTAASENPTPPLPPSALAPPRDRTAAVSFASKTTKNIDSDSSTESEKGLKKHEDADHEKTDLHDGANDHAHGHAAATPFSLVASAVVCFIIYFVFCIVFSSVVWDPLSGATSLDPRIDPPFGIPQGVGINLMGIAVGSVFFSWKSGCKAVVGGPDLLPIVFFAEAGASVLAYLIKVQEEAWPGGYGCAQPYASAADYEDAHRFLGGGGADAYASADPCAHRFLAGGDEATLKDPELFSKIVPTTLVAMMIGNVITALVFYGLGKMKNTASVIGFIPSSVVAGFLTCIGYKVIKLAVLISTGYAFKEKYIHKLGLDHMGTINDPWLPLTISIVYGVVLYGLKRAHVVAAEKLILGFIIVPLVIFFVICAGYGTSMDTLREYNWFLTQARDGNGCTEHCAFTVTRFWQTLEVAYGSGKYVAWSAVPRCIPIFIMGATMTSLDSMLKLTSSEKALGIDLDYNHEMKLGGKASLLSSLLCGSPAYGQTKFNVINFSIARTADSSLPTIYLGGICLLVFLSGVAGPIINFMPRFLLGGLCVFAGVGFLYENLWEGRNNMNRVSFGIVWVIFLVNFIWEFFVLQNLPKDIQPMVPGLLVVFILGIVLSTFEFMFAFMHKAKAPVIKSGDVCCSSAIRSEKHDTQLAVMSSWFQVFAVESFVFFGTANTLYQNLKAHLAEQKTSKPKAERTKYLIFDLTEVTGIDSSAKDVFFKVHRLLKAEGINLVWAMGNPKIVNKFINWGLTAGTTHFTTLDLALRNVEDQLLLHAHELSAKWLVNPTVRKIFERQVLANVFNISVRSDEKRFSSARLQPWAQMINLPAAEEFCGEDDDNLYMLYAGEVQIRGRDGKDHSIFTGSFFNIDQLLISIGALPGLPSTLGGHATKDSSVLLISRSQFTKMQKEDGALAQKLLMTLIVQNESNRPGRVRPTARHRSGLGEKLDDSTRSRGNKAMAGRLLKGDDYKINLTDAQKESFEQIFNIIVEPGEEDVSMDMFSAYVSGEAKALGSQIEHKQFMDMIDDSGIDEDGDGVLTVDEFLSFLRGLFLDDIPSSEVPFLKEIYEAAVAEAPDQPMNEFRVQVLFASLGFDVDSSAWQDVMGVIDADGDGDVDFFEFLTGIGMMKKCCLLLSQLDAAFQGYKEESIKNQKRNILASSRIINTSKRNMGVSALTKSFALSSKSQDQLVIPSDDDDSVENNGVELDAGDLEAFLAVPRDMAEEMVFLADQDEVEAVQNKQGSQSQEVSADRTIDREEFQQLLRSWS